MEILPPSGRRPRQLLAKTAKTRPTPGVRPARSAQEPPEGHSCRTQHLGSGGARLCTVRTPVNCCFHPVPAAVPEVFSLVLHVLTSQASNRAGMPESTSPSRGILRRKHNILCFAGCTGNAPPPHTLSTGLHTRPVGASRGTRREVGSPKRDRPEPRAKVAPAKLRAVFDGNVSKYPGTHCP